MTSVIPEATPDPRDQRADGAREHDEPTPCHLYPDLCTTQDGEDGDQADENGRHFDHGGDAITVPSDSFPEDPEIWAEFTHCSASTPHIGFMSESLTPDQAHEKAAQLRKFADDLDDLADQTAAALALYRIREARANADGPWAEILDIVLDQIGDGSDPQEVMDQVLTLMQQARAERAGARA